MKLPFRILDIVFVVLFVGIYTTVFTERLSLYRLRAALVREYARQDRLELERERRPDEASDHDAPTQSQFAE